MREYGSGVYPIVEDWFNRVLGPLIRGGIDPVRRMYGCLDDVPGNVPRGYHRWEHVLDVAWAQRDADPIVARGLAALFHDCIYCPGAKDNEARSAAKMRELVTGADEATLAEAERLILLTAKHGQWTRADFAADPIGAEFLDADLCSLAFPWEIFRERNAGVEDEYAAVFDADTVRAGRRKFVEGMLSRPTIYLSDYFGEDWEWRARCNLERLLAEGAHAAVIRGMERPR